MKITFFTIILLFVYINRRSGWAIEVIVDRAVIDFYNKSHIAFMKMIVRKPNRHSPYVIDFEYEALSGFGNNVTIIFWLMEYLSNGYQPTPVTYSMKLCDFLYRDWFIGQMLAKQLPTGWTCPFETGKNAFSNITINLENFPFKLPFTWPSVNVKPRADLKGIETDTKADLFSIKLYVTLIMKPKKKS